jgi:putative membrane protein
MYDGTFGWWGFGMMLFMAVFWIFVIAAAVWLVTTLTRRSGGTETQSSDGSALRILEERLARGEIDIEEFRARKAAIEGARR